jgi:hypothetical protein
LNNSKDKRKIAMLQWATLAVVLGPAGENGLAHLGLLARSVETGELAPEVGVPIWGIGGGGAHHGGLAAVKKVDSGERATTG